MPKSSQQAHRPSTRGVLPVCMSGSARELSTSASTPAGGALEPTAVAAASPGSSSRQPSPSFEQRCRQLEAYIQQHGHSRVPLNEPSGLGRWASQQRHAWKTGRLSAARQQQLAVLGMCPDAVQDAWSARFRQLAAFHSANGHCRMPHSGPAARQYPGLYAWLHHQLHLWRQGTLADDRRRRLAGLGVEWGWCEAAWEARFQELLEFRQEFGHTMVPASWPGNPGLVQWVQAQRRRWQGTQGAPLTPAQQGRLLGCGFQFSPLQDGWERRYAQLCELRLQHEGDLLAMPLPQGLASWLTFQRRQWRLGRLAPERAARLEALGIQRSLRHKSWRQRLASLDRLVDTLGFPATHALLLLAPASSAPGMAAEAVSSASVAHGKSSSTGAAPTPAAEDEGQTAGQVGPESSGLMIAGGQRGRGAGLTASEAADVVRWHRSLRVGKMPAALAQALVARGLGPVR
ncbi:hypothetical protein ABPG75_013252 [Micractinium tetrahymenae]